MRGLNVCRLSFAPLGLYGKQVSAFFQTLACKNTISGNVIYNGPRSAINFNEGQ
jgi:hypothetical protein